SVHMCTYSFEQKKTPPLFSIATALTKSPKNLKTRKVHSLGLPQTLILGVYRAKSPRSGCCTIGLSHILRSQKMPKCIGKLALEKFLKIGKCLWRQTFFWKLLDMDR